MAAIITAFLSLTIFSVSARPLKHRGCASELLAFGPCYLYLPTPPNHIAATVPPECCIAFSSVLSPGDGYCLCYLLQQPLLFPLNQSALATLPSLCLPNIGVSMEFLCSGVPPLPPLPPLVTAGHGPGQTQPSNSDGAPVGSNPLTNKPPESVNASMSPPAPPGFPVKPAANSSATKWDVYTWFVLPPIVILFLCLLFLRPKEGRGCVGEERVELGYHSFKGDTESSASSSSESSASSSPESAEKEPLKFETDIDKPCPTHSRATERAGKEALKFETDIDKPSHSRATERAEKEPLKFETDIDKPSHSRAPKVVNNHGLVERDGDAISIYFFMNPSPAYEVTFLNKLSYDQTCGSGKSSHEVANYR